ncbi:MAG: hypothetical protein LBD45_04995, partial [Bacteroidales bacterium]|nr:hypothetical protein [Bacteroidales bacterium]
MKTLLFALIFTVIPLFAFSQADTVRNTELNKPWNYSFVSIGGGSHYFVGDGIRSEGQNMFNSNRLGYPILTVSLGKMFSPAIGLRIQGYGNFGIGKPLKDSWPVYVGNSVEYNDLNYFGVQGDVLINTGGLFAGYNPNRFFELIPYFGISYVNRFTINAADNVIGHGAVAADYSISSNIGLLARFRLSKSLDLNLEIMQTILPESFNGVYERDGYFGDNREIITASMLGLTYKFGSRSVASLRTSDANILNSFWFFSIGGGIQYFIGDYVNQGIYYTNGQVFTASLGKMFSPVIGLRLQGYGNFGIVRNSIEYNALNYFGVQGNVLINTGGLFAGYNPNRFFELIPYFGIGYVNRFEIKAEDNVIGHGAVPADQAISSNVGLLARFRLTKSLDLNLEFMQTVLPESFNGLYDSGDNQEFFAATMLGLTYKFGSRTAAPLHASNTNGLNLFYRRKIINQEVDLKMNEWVKMMQGETMEEYAIRVNDETRTKQMELFALEATTALAGNRLEMENPFVGDYNSEDGLLAINFATLTPIEIPVPVSEVSSFDKNKLKFENAVYSLTENDEFKLVYLEVTNEVNNKVYIYDNIGRTRMTAIAVDSSLDLVPLEILQIANQEEMQLQAVTEHVVNENKQEKLISDNTQINVRTEVIADVDADGNKILNYRISYQYEVMSEEFSARDDFPSGEYDI